METLTHNKWSTIGMILGALALMTAIAQFTFGPFNRQPPLERVVAEQVSALKKGIIAGLKGEKPLAIEVNEERFNRDRLLTAGSIGMAIAALFMAFIAGMRKENRWSIHGALLFGGVTLTFHAVIFGMAIMSGILVLLIILTGITVFLG